MHRMARMADHMPHEAQLSHRFQHAPYGPYMAESHATRMQLKDTIRKTARYDAFVKSAAQGTQRYAFKYVYNFPPPAMFNLVVLDDI